MSELSIDTASEVAGVALTQDGKLVSELTWRTMQNHSKELLPAVDWLLARSGLSKADLSAVFVCIGPGSYAGLRVGLSTAKALAYALGIPIVGVGRLEADAESVPIDEGRRIVAVHTAGRAELAWAAHRRGAAGMEEEQPPRLSRREAFMEDLQAGDLVCGEVDEELGAAIEQSAAHLALGSIPRIMAVARLGWKRLAAGAIDSADSLVPLYLREPAIGPQTPHPPAHSPSTERGS
jgi:tRNA threonylcarbamoyladenosine biosynthesis protein TsaB